LLSKLAALIRFIYLVYRVWHDGVSERSAEKNICILKKCNDRRS